MELLQLKYFCDAAQTENFSKTANKYHVPPSNISQSIKRLEVELGVKLFNRKSNCLTLNKNGENFYKKVKEALNILENAQAEISDNNDRGVLKICIMTNRFTVSKTIEKFAKKYPDIVISSSYSLSADSEDFDIIISDDNLKSDNTEREMIVSEGISLAINTENPLAHKAEINGEDLAKENFICMNEESSLFSTTKKICDSMNFQPNIVMQSPDPVFVRKCVDLNLGVAFAPAISWQGQFSDKVVLKKLEGFYRTTYAYKNKNKFNKKSITNFIEMLKKDFI